MGHGDSRIGRGGNAGGDPGHDLHRDALAGQVGRLLATAAKEEGITTLEPHHRAVAAGQLRQQGIGAGLGHRMVAAALAHKVLFAVAGHQIEQGLGHQGVVHEGIAAPQQAMGLEGEQLGVAGAGPHQVDGAGGGKAGQCRVGSMRSARRSEGHGRASSCSSNTWRRAGRLSRGAAASPKRGVSASVRRLAAKASGRTAP